MTGLCKGCKDPLTVLIERDDDRENDLTTSSSTANQSFTIDDDVELECGCHFHWQCLLDAYTVAECPSCGRNLWHNRPSGKQQILCNLRNEGGLQEALDILPLLTEETYLRTFPEERKCRAFLEFCAEGDIEAIVDLLDDEDESQTNILLDDRGMTKESDILRYQDSLGSMSSGLHAAIANGKVEVAWLLLFLASKLPFSQFPPEVLNSAEELRIQRENQETKIDIRALEDSEGLTAAQYAMNAGGIWHEWISSGRLLP